jgi:type VI secretion system secreted protein VgrG
MSLLGRDTLVTSSLPAGTLLLESFSGHEKLGEPYRYDLTLLSENSNIAMDEVLGQPLAIRIEIQPGRYRYFHGIVTYFAKIGLTMSRTRYRAIVNPKLSLFGYTRDCRIMNEEGQTALTIVSDCLAQRGFTDLDLGSVSKDHLRTREYCLQYRETDLHFIQRLLEEEGIYYFFKHEENKHTMVLANALAAHAKVPGYEAIRYLPRQHKQAREEEHFWELSVAGALYPGDYTVVQGYDYTKTRPTQVLFGKKPSTASQPGTDFEDYDYPGGLSIAAEAKEEALIREETDSIGNTRIEVQGNTMGLGVGDLVKLIKSPLDASLYNPFWSKNDLEKDYIITSADYEFSINQYETGDTGKSDEPFKATYTLVDSQAQIRPERGAKKPRIEGPQTAVVVGPSGEEIYTDKYGRVKVQFDWDRLGQNDEESSCWIRVAQIWAGKQWGAMHIPRIGHEVIVEFLDGDPDRPIITGRVYNNDNMPPYSLPDNKTQSGIKSRSSKDGSASNFNEIRFEDLKGKEELHIQAEKDMSTLVKNNQSTTVGGNRTVTVHGKQTTEVTKDEAQTYKADRTMDVTGANRDTIEKEHTGLYKMGRTMVVSGKDDILVVNTSKAISVKGTCFMGSEGVFGISHTDAKADAGDAEIFLDANKISIGNKSKSTIFLTEGKITISAPDNIDLTCGSAGISLSKDGTVTIKGSSKVVLTGGSASSVTLDASAAAIVASTIKLNS